VTTPGGILSSSRVSSGLIEQPHRPVARKTAATAKAALWNPAAAISGNRKPDTRWRGLPEELKPGTDRALHSIEQRAPGRMLNAAATIVARVA